MMMKDAPSLLSVSEPLYQQGQAFEPFSPGVVWLNEAGQMLDFNEAFVQELGVENLSFEKKKVSELAPALTIASSDWTSLWKELQSNKQVQFKFFKTNADGTSRLVPMRGNWLEIEGQSFCCAVCESDSKHKSPPSIDFLKLNKIGGWQWNLEKQQVIFSEHARLFLNIPKLKEFMSVIELYPLLTQSLFPKEYAALSRQLQEGIEKGNKVDVEFSIRNEAHKRRFRCLAIPLQHEGRTVQLWGTVQDISETIERTEEMYLTKYCLDNVREMVYWIDEEGHLRYVNSEMCQKLGYTREELLQMKLWNLRNDLNESRWHYQWGEFRKGKVLQMEVNFRAKNQQEIPFYITGYHLKFRGQEFACIFGKDLRQDKRRDEILRLTRYSLNNTQEMVYWIREDGSFYYFNDAFAAKLGYTREEVQHMRMLHFFPDFSEADFQQGWQRLRNGEILSREIEIRHRNGFNIPIQTYVTLIALDGETFACGILSDVSERKRKQEELSAAFAEMKQMQAQFELDNYILKEEIAEEYQFNNIISTSNAYKKVLKQVEQASRVDATVLLRGEMGTGKELLAHALHQLSRRASRPLVKINCGAIAEYFLESELFGHEKNAFPGAFQTKRGRFELADGGTIFFNEIANLPLSLQEKLFQFLENGTFCRMGSNDTIQVDVRVVAATNRNLESLVEKGLFRADLFNRIGALTIHNLPLRERREDIPLLVRHFVEKYARKAGKSITSIPRKMLQALDMYAFPGNVRELENMVERAVILSSDEILQLESTSSTDSAALQGFKSLEEAQRDHIIQALKLTKGQITGEGGAAKLLQMNDQTLYSRMKKLKINRYEWLS